MGRQKVPVDVPRVRNKKGRGEVKVRSYYYLKKPHKLDGSAFKNILYGISCRRYKEAASSIPEAFGDKVLIQRCQWHKIENVVSYLSRGCLEMTYRIDFIFGANWCSINNVGVPHIIMCGTVAQIKGHPDKSGYIMETKGYTGK